MGGATCVEMNQSKVANQLHRKDNRAKGKAIRCEYNLTGVWWLSTESQAILTIAGMGRSCNVVELMADGMGWLMGWVVSG